MTVLVSARPLNVYNASLELSARSKRQLADLVVKKFDFYPNGDNYEIPYEYTDDLDGKNLLIFNRLKIIFLTS